MRYVLIIDLAIRDCKFQCVHTLFVQAIAICLNVYRIW